MKGEEEEEKRYEIVSAPFPLALLKAVEDYLKVDAHLTKSELVRVAVKEYLEKRGFYITPRRREEKE